MHSCPAHCPRFYMHRRRAAIGSAVSLAMAPARVTKRHRRRLGDTMPVVHMRIDNRLIHGQVTSSWVNAIGANRLIVTNDQVAKDPVQTMLLPQAARGVPTSVLSIADTIAYAQSPQGQREKIFVIAKLPSDALRLLEGGLQPQAINVGNQAPVPATKFKMVTNSIAVTEDDAGVYRKIAEMNGGRLTTQMVPTERQLDFLEVLKQKGL